MAVPFGGCFRCSFSSRFRCRRFGLSSIRYGSFRRFFSFRNSFGRRLIQFANVDTARNHFSLQAIEHRPTDKFTIQADCAHRVVVPRNREVDLGGITVRVDHRDDRDAEAVGLLDGIRLLAGVDDHQRARQAVQVANPVQVAPDAS